MSEFDAALRDLTKEGFVAAIAKMADKVVVSGTGVYRPPAVSPETEDGNPPPITEKTDDH
jgi:hypothetical protein